MPLNRAGRPSATARPLIACIRVDDEQAPPQVNHALDHVAKTAGGQPPQLLDRNRIRLRDSPHVPASHSTIRPRAQLTLELTMNSMHARCD
jgi:hypothetical protein